LDEFIFNPITLEDIEELQSSSNIFNLTRDELEREKVILASFEDESLGSSKEHLDVAVFRDNSWRILDIESKIQNFNEIPIGYLIHDESCEKIMVIIRMMSSMLTDKVKSNIISYIYYIVPEKYSGISSNMSLFGNLAKNHICLDDSEETMKSLQKLGIYDEVMRLAESHAKNKDEN
jgi:hypothetical protein